MSQNTSEVGTEGSGRAIAHSVQGPNQFNSQEGVGPKKSKEAVGKEAVDPGEDDKVMVLGQGI